MQSSGLTDIMGSTVPRANQIENSRQGKLSDKAAHAGQMIRVDHKSGVPLYVQIGDQLRLMVATGKLSRGAQLPTIRELSVELTVNPNTVARVYAELEREGLLATRPGRGTFVIGPSDSSSLAALSGAKLEQLVERMFTEARNLGYPLSAVEACLERQIARWREQEMERRG